MIFWLPLFTQPPDTLWTKTYGDTAEDYGESVQQTTDGGYILTGHTSSFGAGSLDVYLIKTDSLGETLWTRTFGGIDEDRGYSVLQAREGGYIIVGGTKSFGTGDFDLYLIKTDQLGETLWTRTYGGTGFDMGYSISNTLDGCYIITGRKSGANGGVWLLKISGNGDTLWSRTFGGNCGYAVKQTADSGYIIAGSNGKIWLVKTDANGDTLWTKSYIYSPGSAIYCTGLDVSQTYDLGYIVSGYSIDWTGDYRVMDLLKTDSLGRKEWHNWYGEWTFGYSVLQTPDSGYVVGGEDYGAVYILKTYPNGSTKWEKHVNFPYFSRGRDIQQTSDNGFIVVGDRRYMHTFTHDVVLIKLSAEPGIEDGMELKEGGWRISNPVYGGFLRLSGITGSIGVELLDILGRRVLSQTVSPQRPYLNLRDLRSGIYFLKVSGQKPELIKVILIR